MNNKILIRFNPYQKCFSVGIQFQGKVDFLFWNIMNLLSSHIYFNYFPTLKGTQICGIRFE